MKTQYKTDDRKLACKIIEQAHPGFDRSTESDQARHGGFRPEPFANQLSYGLPELIALDRQQTRIAEGWSIKLAGEEALRLHRAMIAQPGADRLALVTLENRNRFAVDAESIDLTTGYSSGSPIREALVVDVRNLKARLERMIEAAGQSSGSLEDAA